MNRYILLTAVFFLLSCSEGDTVNNYYITPESSSGTMSSSSSLGSSSSSNASSSSSTQTVSSSGYSSGSLPASSSSESGTSSSGISSGVSSSSTESSVSSSSKAEGDFIIDSRDGTKYKITTIGTQVWMAENLRYEYAKNTSLCKDYDCDTYGRLYSWARAMVNDESLCNSKACNPQPDFKYGTICPEGWHLPNNNEWQTLIDYVGDMSLLRANSNLYGDRGLNNPDSFGFSALPSGYSGFMTPSNLSGLDGIGDYGLYWSATEFDATQAYWFSIGYTSNNGSGKRSFDSKRYGLSVRCVKD